MVLSLLSQGRNDSYMGNFLWRTATTLKKHLHNFESLNFKDVEILITDWGSDTWMWETLNLPQNPYIKFILVPKEIAKLKQKDAIFSTVHPINTAARRASGKFIMHCDSDIYIPTHDFKKLIDILPNSDNEFFQFSRKHIPNQFIKSEPSQDEIDAHIAKCSEILKFDKVKENFQGESAGFLCQKWMWFESGGYDERFIYWGFNDIDLHNRLKKKYKWNDMVKLGAQLYHLEHYEDGRKIFRRPNSLIPVNSFNPNGLNWGLNEYKLEIVGCRGESCGFF